jgi:hypothetical protein
MREKEKQSQQVRYQVMVEGEPIKNFASNERREALAYYKRKRVEGKKPSWWDCQSNPMSGMF